MSGEPVDAEEDEDSELDDEDEDDEGDEEDEDDDGDEDDDIEGDDGDGVTVTCAVTCASQATIMLS